MDNGKKQQKRKYYLHSSLRKLKGVTVLPKKKTIYIPFNMKVTKKMKELQNSNYSIQTEIQ